MNWVLADLLRRVGMTGALAIAVIAGCIASAQAQNKVVHLLSWGGTVQATLEAGGLAKKFQEETGYEVVLVPKKTSSEIIATAIAQRGAPQVDVVLCDYMPFLQGIKQDIFADLDPAKLPNMAKLYGLARAGKNVVIPYGDTHAILYQPEVYKKNGWEAPKGWEAFMRPELQGKMVIPTFDNTYGFFMLVKFAELNGGGIDNIDPGFEALAKIAPGVIEWTDTWGQMGVQFQSEAAALGTYGYARAKAMRDKGIPSQVVLPEGSYFNPFGAGIVKNAPNPEGAYVLLNWLLGKTFLSYRSKQYADIVMNTEAETGEGTLSPKEVEGLVLLPFDKVVDRWADLQKRFQREIEGKR